MSSRPVASAGAEERWLFASDVHLSPAEADRTELFHRFLEEEARHCARLFLLGDIFDYYIGPRHLPDYRATTELLVGLRRAGVVLHFLHGNRDFQVGRELPVDHVHAEDIVVEHAGRRILLAHGDLFCTRDVSYQRARRILRSSPVRRLAANAPLESVLAVARALRGYSKKAVREKGAAITDLTASAVARAFEQCDVAAIIAGHVHRERDLERQVDGREERFLGLGAWHDHGSYVEAADGELRYRRFG